MRNLVSGMIAVLLVGLLTSCVSLQDREMNANERVSAQVLGSVEVKFTSYQWVHSIDESGLKTKAYSKLKQEAQKKYAGNAGNIDIKNVVITGSFNPLNLLGFYGLGNFQTITATGDVVLIDTRRTDTSRVEGALPRAAKDVLKNVPARSRIAIVYITAQDRGTTEYIAGELEYIWVNEGYLITDRSQLDRIRREQNFQMSGEVDDQTAVSVGKMIGANIIVTGRVDGEGSLRRLRLRALNTQTAQVVGAASERL